MQETQSSSTQVNMTEFQIWKDDAKSAEKHQASIPSSCEDEQKSDNKAVLSKNADGVSMPDQTTY